MWEGEQQIFKTNASILSIDSHINISSPWCYASYLFNCSAPSLEHWLTLVGAATASPAATTHIMQLSYTKLLLILTLIELQGSFNEIKFYVYGIGTNLLSFDF